MFRFPAVRLAVNKGLPIDIAVERLPSEDSSSAVNVDVEASPSTLFSPSALSYQGLVRSLSWSAGETGVKYASFDFQASPNELEWVCLTLKNSTLDAIGQSNQAHACIFSEGAAPNLDVVTSGEYIRSIRVSTPLYQETQRDLIVKELYSQLNNLISQRFQETVIADQRIEPFRVVAFQTNNRIIHADNANTAIIQSAYAFSLNAGDAGNSIQCAFAGFVSNPNWSLEVGRIYYLINEGLITSIPTYNRGSLLPVGVARTPKKLLIRFIPPGLSVPEG